MITQKYKTHPRYQSSGEEWLGEVPSTWKVLQLKHLSVVKRGASPRPIDDPKYFSEDGEYAWTRIADVSASKTFLIKSTQRLSKLGSSLSVKLQPGELFLSIAGSVGKPCITKIKACIHDGFVYFPELKTPPKFLFYIFAGEQAYKGLGKFGTQLNLNTDTVGSIKVGLPPLPEQIQIARFLDHETGKIDLLIEKQQELIALLKEKRQAVISHAVTKGLNPQAPLKDSGIEWLGQVPEHWQVTRFKFTISEGSAGPYGSSLTKSMYTTVGVRVYGQQQVIPDDFAVGDYYIPPKKFRELQRHLVSDDDMLVSVMGTIGRVAIVPQNAQRGIINPRLVKYRVSEKQADPYFVKEVFHSNHIQDYFSLNSIGTTMDGLNMQIIGEAPISLPPLKEQKEILQFIKKSQDKLGKLISFAETQITLLQERRTALISAAVTGKIDVRDWEPSS